MSCFIYQTEGFILRKDFWNETGSRFLIFTRKFGLVWVEAKGTRTMKSKLRYHLSLYSLTNFSLVNTRFGRWRLVGAESINSQPFFLSSAQNRFLVANWSSLINRLLGYGEEHPSLYEDLVTSLFVLSDKELTTSQVKSLEVVFILRLLSHLGYRPLPKFCQEFLAVNDWQDKALLLEEDRRPAFIREINKSINSADL